MTSLPCELTDVPLRLSSATFHIYKAVVKPSFSVSFLMLDQLVLHKEEFVTLKTLVRFPSWWIFPYLLNGDGSLFPQGFFALQ